MSRFEKAIKKHYPDFEFSLTVRPFFNKKWTPPILEGDIRPEEAASILNYEEDDFHLNELETNGGERLPKIAAYSFYKIPVGGFDFLAALYDAITYGNFSKDWKDSKIKYTYIEHWKEEGVRMDGAIIFFCSKSIETLGITARYMNPIWGNNVWTDTAFSNPIDDGAIYAKEKDVARVGEALGIYRYKARDFAREKHDGQYRKYPADKTYITHPEEVVKILEGININDDTILSAAWLHDVAEDCNVSLDEIRKEFNNDIAVLVEILTKGDDKEEYAKRFLNTDRRAQLIKLADVAHNSEQYRIALSKEKAERFEYLCRKYYLPLAERIWPSIAEKILKNIGVN